MFGLVNDTRHQIGINIIIMIEADILGPIAGPIMTDIGVLAQA